MATVARYIRAEMIEVLSSDYILLAKEQGIHPCVCTIWTCIKKCTYTNYYNYCTNVSGDSNWYVNNRNIFGVPGLGDQFVRSITTNDFLSYYGYNHLI